MDFIECASSEGTLPTTFAPTKSAPSLHLRHSDFHGQDPRRRVAVPPQECKRHERGLGWRFIED